MKKIKTIPLLRKLPILALALLLALSPMLLAAPAHASSDVLTGSDSLVPGYHVSFDGSSVVLPLLYFEGVELSEAGLLSAFAYNYGSYWCRVFVGDLDFIEIDAPSYSDVFSLSLKFNSGFYCYIYSVEPGSSNWILSSTVEPGIDRYMSFMFYKNDPLYCLNDDRSLILVDELDTSIDDYIKSAVVVLEPTSRLGILSVFTGVGSWLSGAVRSAASMFWTAESGLSVLGYLAVASLALAVILLLLYLIASWLKFR